MTNLDNEEDAISNIEGSSLFSDGDSDIVDSPTDGYFSQRSHPHRFFVQNEQSIGSKAQDPDRSPVGAQDHSTESHVPTQHPTWQSEQIPLLDAGPAPPDYYAATADRRAAGHSTRMHYGSIAREEQDEGSTQETPRILLQAGLFGTRTRQSMSNARMDSDHAENQGERQFERLKNRQRWSCSGTRWCVSIVTVIIVVMVIVLVGVTIPQDEPIATPTPSKPEDGRDSPRMPPDSLPTHPSSPRCSYGTFSDSWHYDFTDLTNFTFEEDLKSRQGLHYNVGGSIWIRAAPDDQVADVRVTVSFVTSSGVRVVKPGAVATNDYLKLTLPETHDNAGQQGMPCMEAGIVIEVKKGVSLDHWTINTSHFDILALAQLFDDSTPEADQWSGVGETSTFITHSGKIDAAYWSSRETIIDTVSGSVQGRYALRDLLSITTLFGSVNIDVDPRDAADGQSQPAVFEASSQSGSIKAEFPITSQLPLRVYETSVDSKSGSISGAYIHGSKTNLRTSAGAIVATLLPFAASSDATQLTTETLSGSTSLEILSPYNRQTLHNLRSKHDSSHGSGSIRVKYPTEWAGSFTARSVTGSLAVHGDDVEVDWSSRFAFLGGKRVVGRKGIGDSLIDISTTTGSIDLGIGSGGGDWMELLEGRRTAAADGRHGYS